MSMLNHDVLIFYILLTQFTLERHDHANNRTSQVHINKRITENHKIGSGPPSIYHTYNVATLLHHHFMMVFYRRIMYSRALES